MLLCYWFGLECAQNIWHVEINFLYLKIKQANKKTPNHKTPTQPTKKTHQNQESNQLNFEQQLSYWEFFFFLQFELIIVMYFSSTPEMNARVIFKELTIHLEKTSWHLWANGKILTYCVYFLRDLGQVILDSLLVFFGGVLFVCLFSFGFFLSEKYRTSLHQFPMHVGTELLWNLGFQVLIIQYIDVQSREKSHCNFVHP